MMTTRLPYRSGSVLRLCAVIAALVFVGPVGIAHAAQSPSQEDAVITTPAPEETATAGHAADTAAEHKSGGLPQLDFSTYAPQLVWMGVLLLILYVVMSKKALPQMGSTIETRKNVIDSDIQSAETMQAEVNNIREGYERGLDLARMQASSAVQEVEAAAKKKLSDELEKFRIRSHEQMASAEGKIDAAKAKVMGEMNNVAAEVASHAAEKITGISTDVQKAKAIVDTIAGKAKAA